MQFKTGEHTATMFIKGWVSNALGKYFKLEIGDILEANVWLL